MLLNHFSRVWHFATLWIAARQAPLSMGFSRQEYSNGLLVSFRGNLPDSGIEPESSALPADFFIAKPPGKPLYICTHSKTWSMLVFILFLMWAIFKVSVESATVLLLFYVSVCWPQSMRSLGSPTRGGPTLPTWEGEVLTAGPPGKSQFTFFKPSSFCCRFLEACVSQTTCPPRLSAPPGVAVPAPGRLQHKWQRLTVSLWMCLQACDKLQGAVFNDRWRRICSYQTAEAWMEITVFWEALCTHRRRALSRFKNLTLLLNKHGEIRDFLPEQPILMMKMFSSPMDQVL